MSGPAALARRFGPAALGAATVAVIYGGLAVPGRYGLAEPPLPPREDA